MSGCGIENQMSEYKFVYHGDLTRNSWLLEWFGLHGGRELGDPEQKFTNNPNDIIAFVDQCRTKNRPAFMSVAPRVKHSVILGVDRVFFDFDAKDDKDRKNMELDVREFIRRLKLIPVNPMIVKTYHGYHVYVFFKHGTVKVDGKSGKAFYEAIQQLLINSDFKHPVKYNSLDTNIMGDVKRISRIPTSWHEKGAWCIVVDENLEPTKIRGLDWYRSYGLDSTWIMRAKLQVDCNEKRAEKNNKVLSYNKPPSGQFHIRPCFIYILDGREMGHQHRLALVIEAFWAGKKSNEIIDLFRKRHDFHEETTIYQVNWELEKIQREHLKPYRCETLIRLGYCIKHRCPIWNRKFK